KTRRASPGRSSASKSQSSRAAAASSRPARPSSVASRKTNRDVRLMSDNASFAITPEQVLSLAGRLDDAPGFDTPRERFRRFLMERAAHLPTIQALIEEWQRALGEQHHRVLQDLIVVVGRVLRFAITFGIYEPSA